MVENDGIIVEQVFQLKSLASAFIAGALAGAVAKTAIAPFDRTKIYFQISSTQKYSVRSAMDFAINTYKQKGIVALYRGNSVMLARVMPFAAIQFASFEQFKILLKVDENGKSTPFRRFLSGTLAAVISTSITYPLDTARTRFAANQEYKTFCSVFLNEYKTWGFSSFYWGILPTLYGIIPYAGLTFFTISTLKFWYKEQFGKQSGLLENFCFGASAGVIGQTFAYPFEIVRRRMQVGKIPTNRSVIYTLYEIRKNEGIVRGLYKGLSMNWIKAPISAGIVFATYDVFYKSFQSFFDKLKNE